MFEEQNEFIEQHDGNLTPEQAALLLEMAMAEGDTAPASAETNETPNVGNQKAEEPKVEDKVGDAPELEAENAVILAKDGQHTIPYDKLVEARDGEKAARAELAEVRKQLEEALAAKGNQDAQTQQQLTQQVAAVDAASGLSREELQDLFGDFSEEGLAKGVEKLIDQAVQTKIKAFVEERLNNALSPLQQKQQVDATELHYRTIYEAHPDADSIAESQEMATWIKAQPSFTQAAIEQVLKSGTAEQVIEVFNAFKASTGNAVAKHENVKQSAQEMVKKVGNPAPVTLTDVPSGRAAPVSTEAALLNLSGGQLMEAMGDWSPEQIERYLNGI